MIFVDFLLMIPPKHTMVAQQNLYGARDSGKDPGIIDSEKQNLGRDSAIVPWPRPQSQGLEFAAQPSHQR